MTRNMVRFEKMHGIAVREIVWCMVLQVLTVEEHGISPHCFRLTLYLTNYEKSNIQERQGNCLPFLFVYVRFATLQAYWIPFCVINAEPPAEPGADRDGR